MSLSTVIRELWHFFLDYIWKFILWGIIGAVFLTFGHWLLAEHRESIDQEAYDYLEMVYSQEPAEFQALISLEDGEVFGNSYVFDEYFTSPEILNQMEELTDVPLNKWINSEHALELFKTSLFRGGIAGIRNTSSGVITFRFLVAPTAEENLKVANAYRDLLMAENSIPFMESQTPTIMLEPMIGEVLDLEQVTEVPTENTLTIFNHQNLLTKMVVLIAGFIVGAGLSFVFYFIKRLLSDTIVYAFEYQWYYEDFHRLIEQTDDLDTLMIKNSLPLEVIAQFPINNNAIHKSISETLHTIVKDSDPGKECIIVIQSGQTTKEWYKVQFNTAKYYHLPLQIIHISREIK